jgi:hypothetical protein
MSKVKEMKTEIEEAVKVITPEQLEKVKGLQNDLQKYFNHIAGLEVQKSKAIEGVTLIEKEMDKAKKEIEDQYGAININLMDGSYEEIEADVKE